MPQSPPAPASPLQSLSGLIERVTYHNPDTGYCVLRLKTARHRDLITVIGQATSVSAGEFLSASGIWLNDKTYGLQFKATFLKASAPTTQEGLEKYLGSGLIKGIGPIYAKKLVEAFKQEVFEVIEATPEALQTIPGIGPYRSQLITKGWSDQKAIREIMLFLKPSGLASKSR